MSNPMFQHRHYAAIAAAVADASDRIYSLTPNHEAVRCVLIDELTKLFERDNDRFDRSRFIKAARRATDMHGKDKR